MNSVIIVAAGKGSRMNSDINKQYIKIFDKEILYYTIDVFNKSSIIDEIIIVTKQEEEIMLKNVLNLIDLQKQIKITYGGNQRQDSVFNGLKMIDNNCDIVLIHDGARPFIDEHTIKNLVEVAKEDGCAIVGVKVKDTIKKVNEENQIEGTLNREELWAVQTPQVFKKNIIIDAYENAYSKKMYGTDDASLVEFNGYNIKMVAGSYNNIKITTPEDILFAKSILKYKEELCLE